jgi:redox-sensitive bicupin YhaK (pirin superfamily)
MPEIIIDAREAQISESMKVRRILPFRKKRMVGPFTFLDHGGPIDNPPVPISKMDVLPHPHIGLATVTYLIQGQVTHRDSIGVEQIIKPGEVNWMTAGKGISHSERFEDPANLAGGLEMLQTWVALPEDKEEVEPSFNNYTAGELPVYTDKGIWMRLIAGNAYGLRNQVATLSPLFYLHSKIDQGVKFELPKEHSERAVYIVHGEIELNHQKYGSGQMIVFNDGETPNLKAGTDAEIMLLGCEPLGERYIWWNFVSSRKERIEQAKEDWLQGRIALPQLDNEEHIPLPENRFKLKNQGPEPGPLS